MTIYSQQQTQNNGTTGTITVSVGDKDTGGGTPSHVDVSVSVMDPTYGASQQNSASYPPYAIHPTAPNELTWQKVNVIKGSSFVSIMYAFTIPNGAASTLGIIKVFDNRNGKQVMPPQAVNIIVESQAQPILIEPDARGWSIRFDPDWWKGLVRGIEERLERLEKVLEKLRKARPPEEGK